MRPQLSRLPPNGLGMDNMKGMSAAMYIVSVGTICHGSAV